MAAERVARPGGARFHGLRVRPQAHYHSPGTHEDSAAPRGHVMPVSPNPSQTYSASLGPGKPRQPSSTSQISGVMCTRNIGPAITHQ